jgi:hypothetical protein
MSRIGIIVIGAAALALAACQQQTGGGGGGILAGPQPYYTGPQGALAGISTQVGGQRTLSGADIQTIFSGYTGEADTTSNHHILIFFDPNGTTQGKDRDGTVDTGQWGVQGSQLCMRWPRLTNNTVQCYSVTDLGGNRFGLYNNFGQLDSVIQMG